LIFVVFVPLSQFDRVKTRFAAQNRTLKRFG
jgi:hypothetical protein